MCRQVSGTAEALKIIDQGVLYLPTMAIWTIGSVIAGVTASERYHRFWSIFFPLHVISYTTIVLLKLG